MFFLTLLKIITAIKIRSYNNSYLITNATGVQLTSDFNIADAFEPLGGNDPIQLCLSKGGVLTVMHNNHIGKTEDNLIDAQWFTIEDANKIGYKNIVNKQSGQKMCFTVVGIDLILKHCSNDKSQMFKFTESANGGDVTGRSKTNALLFPDPNPLVEESVSLRNFGKNDLPPVRNDKQKPDAIEIDFDNENVSLIDEINNKDAKAHANPNVPV